jgi:hypothetical protein
MKTLQHFKHNKILKKKGCFALIQRRHLFSSFSFSPPPQNPPTPGVEQNNLFKVITTTTTSMQKILYKKVG